MQVDPRFKAARKHAARRRRNSRLRPVLIWGPLAGGLAAGLAALILSGTLRFGLPPPPDVNEIGDATAQIDSGAAYAQAFVDLPGDPMVLHFDRSSEAEHTRRFLRPPDVPGLRAGTDLVLLTDDMVTREERLITTLPSSREDFAFFQQQRATPRVDAPPPPVLPPVLSAALPAMGPAQDPEDADLLDEPAVVVAKGEASWGEDLGGDDGDGHEAPQTYTRTRIENTTSVAFLVAEKQRRPAYEDLFLRLRENTDLTALMTGNGMDAAAARRFAQGAAALIPETAALTPGHILALRSTDRGGVKVPVQLSLYTRDHYFGSLALTDAGEVALAADPWVEEDLFSFAGDDAVAQQDTSRKYRLMDAFYSAAIRNGVPSAVVAETIVMLSQSYDLEAFATPGDRMELLYSPDPGGEGPGPGQVLFAAIRGEGKSLECTVYRMPGKDDYACFGAPGPGGGGGGGTVLRAGFQTPVAAGVLTSRFGPRMHPILKVAKLHKGVDWAAPVGTPVLAAFDGTIRSAGDGEGYGNLVVIDHPNGLQSRYAHLSRFSEIAKAGARVKAGDVIGFVGTTGLSTGPHLHFEVYQGGEAIDPLGAEGGAVASGDAAVDTLVDQIVRVESGGNAAAKNPLSSATGLGQFIEGTWLRMMQTYRPDLAGSMPRDQLLALRNDPTLSREMVTNLAREGEAYLRARGHQITAGRLYLCHFLGAEGASMVLSAQDDRLVVDVMGVGVIRANPFLTGQNIAQLKDWAERKMSRGGGPLPSLPVLPAEVTAFRKVLDALMKSPA
ncbi:MAG: M23 family metallopeptidase [Paracoccaceae bacterium]